MNTQNSAATPPAFAGAVPYPASAQAWYLVFVLLLFYIFSFIDRQIISLLVEPIKRDLQVTDTQIGLLQGFAFAIFYTLFGIPIGRLADRMNRKSIIAVGVVVWSLMATLCGLAKNFWQLFLARIGVGVGEAALSPAAYSMITDAFPARETRSRIQRLQHGHRDRQRHRDAGRRPGRRRGLGRRQDVRVAAARRGSRVAVRLHRDRRARTAAAVAVAQRARTARAAA